MTYKHFIMLIAFTFGVSNMYIPIHAGQNQKDAWQMIKEEVYHFGTLMKEIPIPALTGCCATIAASAVLSQGCDIAKNQNDFTKLILLGASGLVSLYVYYLPHRIAKILIKVCNGNYSDTSFNGIAFLAALTTFAALNHTK